ncbi:hypothetical protein GGP53_002818 [Salinibacter ruber]|nr:hypothetical protein [Salinibacter ruber]MCS4145848.1 hypothetical protein [Salinibacter ruber]
MPSLSIEHAVTRFVRLLDQYARFENCSGWLEKTPIHLHHVDVIQKTVPNPHFVHVLRYGEDTIASLFDVTQRNPEAWGGARHLEDCIGRWVDDVKLSLSYTNLSNHTIIRYSTMVEWPEMVCQEVWGFTGMPSENLKTDQFRDASKKAEPSKAPWQAVDQDVDQKQEKFQNVLTDKQRRKVLDRLEVEVRKEGIMSGETGLSRSVGKEA